MNTSRSTGCVASSSSREMPGVSPSCELFQGTITSDLGASSLPRIDMPDMVTSPPAAALAGFAGLPAVVLAAAVAVAVFSAGPPASLAGPAAGSAAPAPDASSAIAKVMVIRWRMQSLPPAGASLQIGNPDGGLPVTRHVALIGPVVLQCAGSIAQVQVAEDGEVQACEVEVRRGQQCLLV